MSKRTTVVRFGGVFNAFYGFDREAPVFILKLFFQRVARREDDFVRALIFEIFRQDFFAFPRDGNDAPSRARVMFRLEAFGIKLPDGFGEDDVFETQLKRFAGTTSGKANEEDQIGDDLSRVSGCFFDDRIVDGANWV